MGSGMGKTSGLQQFVHSPGVTVPQQPLCWWERTIEMEMKGEGQEGWGLESVVFAHHRLCASICFCVAIYTLSVFICAPQKPCTSISSSVAVSYWTTEHFHSESPQDIKICNVPHKQRQHLKSTFLESWLFKYMLSTRVCQFPCDGTRQKTECLSCHNDMCLFYSH